MEQTNFRVMEMWKAPSHSIYTREAIRSTLGETAEITKIDVR